MKDKVTIHGSTMIVEKANGDVITMSPGSIKTVKTDGTVEILSPSGIQKTKNINVAGSKINYQYSNIQSDYREKFNTKSAELIEKYRCNKSIDIGDGCVIENCDINNAKIDVVVDSHQTMEYEGHTIPVCPTGCRQIMEKGDHVFCDGYELIEGRWKKTFRSFINKISYY